MKNEGSSMETWKKEWLSSTEGEAYGKLFYQRATGELPEMESSKAAARRASRLLDRDGARIADIGCGAGHYLRSLRSAVTRPFQYVGVDATPRYVELAREAFKGVKEASFQEGDIFRLPLPDRHADLVMCNNVLLHLPSVAQPVRELARVSARRVLVRTLVADKSYVIRDVAPHPEGDEFDDNGEPKAFHFLSIYSRKYLERLFRSTGRVRALSFEPDTDFDANKVSDSGRLLANAWDKTEVASSGMQVSGMILLPWTWVVVELDAG
ncbi:MAG TPA: class I SAM-dependent methyltransferase [Burkholderiales bacterium]|nr:class I SAM-dependent methyltransferase [Burkholderiales bacterium]